MNRKPHRWYANYSGLAIGLVVCLICWFLSILPKRETIKLLHGKANGTVGEFRVEGVYSADLEFSCLFREEKARGKPELAGLRIVSENKFVEFRGQGLELVRGIDENIRGVESLSTGGIRILGCRDACDPQSSYAIEVSIVAGSLRILYSDIAYDDFPLGRIPGVIELRGNTLKR